MRSTKRLDIFRGVRLYGFEDDDKDSGGDGGDGDDGSDDGSDDDDGSGDDSGGDGDTSGLKSALRKERKLRRDAEKKAKAAQREKDEADQKEQDELTRAQSERDTAATKLERLSAGYVRQATDTAIMKAAAKMKFIDPDDALKLVDREGIDVEQDDDDPSSVLVDGESVTDALNDLAKKSPHLLVAEGDSQSSGSKFNGSGKGKKESEDERRKREMELYPAMRDRR